MDYIDAANKALATRARLSEELKGVFDDTTLTEAGKEERSAKLSAEIDRLYAEANTLVERAEQETEARSLNERLGGLTAGRQEVRDQRQAVRDEAKELRELATGKRNEVTFDIRTAQSSVAANAGNTKKTTFVAEVLEAMRFRSEFFGLATTMTTSGGETLEWPVKNAINPATAPVQGTVDIVAENTPYPKGDQAWTKTNIGAYKYGIIVEATQEIIDDSELPILPILGADAGETLADKVMADLMVGSGTSKPWGWVTRASAGLNIASLSAITFDNLIDLQHSLIKPYRRNGAYMFADGALPYLRKLKDTTGNYLWVPSVTAGIPDTIWAKPLLTDPNIATAGASAKVGVFGDPKKYLIRQVNQIKVTRSDEYGFDRDVVALKVSWRGSGDLFDLNSVKSLTVTA